MTAPRQTLAVLLILAAALILPAPSVAAQDRREVPDFAVFGEVGPERLTQVQDFIDAFKAAWSTQDAATLAGLHTADTEWINAYARMFRGRDALETFLRDRLFPEFNPAVSVEETLNMRTISIRFIGDDAAVVHMYTDGHRGASRNAGADARRTHLHLVLAGTPGGWRIAHTAIMDAR
jgi:uncharacterized protein (TIGR02246 family)